MRNISVFTLAGFFLFLCLGMRAQAQDSYEDYLWFGKQNREDTTYFLNVKAFHDPDKSVNDLLANYKSFAFDYTSRENPLLEKELFKMLEILLLARGMVRDESDPDVLITMNYYIGKKENYVPNQPITSTRFGYVWTSGTTGSTPALYVEAAPAAENQPTSGKTGVTYYRDIRLIFLDYKSLQGEKKPEIPPLVWMGNVDSEGSSDDIRRVAPVMIKEALTEWPGKTTLPSNREIGVMCRVYGDIGIKTLKDDWKVIKEIVAGSPADQAGLKPGDIIEKINDKKTTPGYDSWCRSPKAPKAFGQEYMAYVMKFYEEDPYFKFVIQNTENRRVKFTVYAAGEKKRKEIFITPEPKSGCRYYRGKIVRDNTNYESVAQDWVQF